MARKGKIEPFPELSDAARAEVKTWLKSSREQIPDFVADALNLSLMVADRLGSTEVSNRGLLTQLRRALGIIPSSERRRPSGDPKSGLPAQKPKKKKQPLAALLDDLARSNRLANWYRKLAREHAKKIKKLEGRILTLNNDKDEPWTEADEAELAAEQAASEGRLALGNRCDLDCARSAESLMTGSAVTVQTEDMISRVDRDSLPRNSVVTQQFFEDRERINFSFNVTKINIEVEKLAITTPAGPTLVSASTEDIGPPKSKVTWEFLASMVVLVAQYALPLNRFAALASSPVKTFMSSEISRHFQYVASRFSAIYLQLAKDLARSEVLMGDDTSSRVIELTKALKLRAVDPESATPWAEYATKDKATDTIEKLSKSGKAPEIGVKLAAALGFECDRKDGSGAKVGFNTSVISGRSDIHDPKSQIVFFRSHLGGFGDILSVILHQRPADLRNIVIQSDLAKVNLISDPALRDKLHIVQVGCAYHARRPFAIFENQDPELCQWILHEFKGLAIFEGALDVTGRNCENTVAVRTNDEREIWERIKQYAGIIARKWSAASDLGVAARYIIRHYERLTYYLKDHRLEISNNFSERMLRLERLIENNALFRQTLNGRFCLDIIRTILQTAIAAKVDLQLYIMWVLSMPPEVVDADPAAFTPLAFARLKSQHIG